MCLPPLSENVVKYFSKLKILNDEFKFNNLSMGMSDDYISAIKFKSNYLRIGSKIFGSRNY